LYFVRYSNFQNTNNDSNSANGRNKYVISRVTLSIQKFHYSLSCSFLRFPSSSLNRIFLVFNYFPSLRLSGMVMSTFTGWEE